MNFRLVIEFWLIVSVVFLSSSLINAIDRFDERFGTSKCDHDQLARSVTRATYCGNEFILRYTKTMLKIFKSEIDGTFDLVKACRTHNELTQSGKNCLLDLARTCFPSYITGWLSRVFSAVELNCACTFENRYSFCLVNYRMLEELMREIHRYYPRGDIISLIAFDKSCEAHEKFNSVLQENGPCFQEKWEPLIRRIVGFVIGYPFYDYFEGQGYPTKRWTNHPWNPMTKGQWPPVSKGWTNYPWNPMTKDQWPLMSKRWTNYPWNPMTKDQWQPVTHRPWPHMSKLPWSEMTYGILPVTDKTWFATYRPWPPVVHRPGDNLDGISLCATVRTTLEKCFDQNSCFSTREMKLFRNLMATAYQRGMEIMVQIEREFGSLKGFLSSIENTTLKWHKILFPVKTGIDMSNPTTNRAFKLANHIIDDFKNSSCKKTRELYLQNMDLLNISRFNQDYEMSSSKPEPRVKTTMANERDEAKDKMMSTLKQETAEEMGDSYTIKDGNGQTGMMQPQKEETEITTKGTSGTDFNFRKEFPILILVLTSFFI